MPFAYITHPGAAVKLSGESLLVTADEQELAVIELAHLEGLITLGRVSVTSPALAALLEHGVPLAMMSRSGRVRGRLVPPSARCIDARLGQFAVLASEPFRLAAARRVVSRKIEAMDTSVARWMSNYPMPAFAAARGQLRQHMQAASAATDIGSLLGIEGNAAKAYWHVFAQANRSELPFGGRSARPPADAVNAMLSFGYALLAQEVCSGLDALGLDPAVGFYHVPRAGRPALALDVMEPFRHGVVDRAVLKAINLRQFTHEDFESRDDGSWRFVREGTGLKRFLEVYEEAMLAKAEASLTEGPRGGDGEGGAGQVTCRDAMRRRCERLLPWFRSVAQASPSWGRWNMGCDEEGEERQAA